MIGANTPTPGGDYNHWRWSSGPVRPVEYFTAGADPPPPRRGGTVAFLVGVVVGIVAFLLSARWRR